MTDTTAATPRWSPLRRAATASPDLEGVIKSLRVYHPRSDIKLLQQAFDKASALHAGQNRRSGEAYITHPVAVTEILADLGMTVPTLAAALLHDTVEDTQATLQDVETLFGGKPYGDAARVRPELEESDW